MALGHLQSICYIPNILSPVHNATGEPEHRRTLRSMGRKRETWCNAIGMSTTRYYFDRSDQSPVQIHNLFARCWSPGNTAFLGRVRVAHSVSAEYIPSAGCEKDFHVDESNGKLVWVKQVLPKDFVEVGCNKYFGTVSTAVQKVSQDTAKEASPV